MLTFSDIGPITSHLPSVEERDRKVSKLTGSSLGEEGRPRRIGRRL